MKMISFWFVLLLLPTTAVRAQAPATQPDLSTPQKTFTAIYDAIESENAAALRALISANGKSARAYADDFVLIMIANHRLHRVLSKKLPAYDPFFWEWASDKKLKSYREDLPRMTIKIEQNRATVSPGTNPFAGSMVLVDKSWKPDFDNLPGFENYPLGDVTPPMMYLVARYSPAIQAIADEVEAGKITTMDQAKKELDLRTGPIQEKVQKELSDLQGAQPAR